MAITLSAGLHFVLPNIWLLLFLVLSRIKDYYTDVYFVATVERSLAEFWRAD